MTNLEQAYRIRHEQFLVPVSEKLEGHIRECLASCDRIDRVCTRAKSVTRFVQKAMKVEYGLQKYDDPLHQIQDQIGARVVTFYPSDVARVAEEVKRYFHPIESQLLVPDAESEFGYVGQHFILLLPSDVTAGIAGDDGVPGFFELQIKTLFQHAWAEAEHDLGYKNTRPLTSLQKRKVAFTAAQAWGADQIFDEMFRELSIESKTSVG